MPIPFQCSKCSANYKAPDHLAGKKIKCKGCGSIEQVPGGASQAPAPQAANSPAQPRSAASAQPVPNPGNRAAGKPPQSRPATTNPASAKPHGAASAAGLGPGQPPLDPFSPADSLVAADPFSANPYTAAAPNPFGPPPGAPLHGMQAAGPQHSAPFAQGLAYSRPQSRGMSPVMVVVLIVGGLFGLGVLGIAGVVLWAIGSSRVEESVAELPADSLDAGPMPTQPVADSSGSSSQTPAENQRAAASANADPNTTPIANLNQPLGGAPGSAAGSTPAPGRTSGAGLSDYGGSAARNLGNASGSAPRNQTSSLARPPEGSEKPLDVPALSAAVPADPLDDSLAFEFSSSKLVSIPIEERSIVTVPYTASPFLAIIARDNKSAQVWDLRTQQPTSSFDPKSGRTSSRQTLSPDGRYYASLNFNKLTLIKTDGKGEPRMIDIGPPLHFIAMTREKLFTIEQVRDPETRVGAAKVRVHELSSGELATEFGFDADWIAQEHNVALSAGGRCLAVFVQKDKARVLEVIDTSTGKIIAECRLPGAGGMHPGGVAFSADGSELAALLNQHSYNMSRLATWSLADGDVASQFPLAHADYEWLRKHGQYQSPPLQPIAGGDGGWFVCGRGVVDRQGKVTRELPAGNSANSSLPRRAFSSDGFLLVGGGHDSLVLTNQPGAAEEKTVSQPVRQAMASSANADLTKAKTVSLPSGAVKWEVAPDPAPAAKEGLGDKPTELKHVDREAISYHFSSPATGIAAIYCMKEKTHDDIVAENNARMAQAQRAAQRVSSGIPGAIESFNKGDNAVIPTPPCWIDRYDLASNEYLGRLNLTRGSVMHDLSPNGERALVQYGNALQVWSLADGKQISQWDVPGLNAQNKAYNDCCLFSDNDHVMARVDSSRIARWRLPDAQAEYVIDKVETAYGRAVERISPGGKYWMTLLQRKNGSAMFAMIETATGQLRGVAAATTLGGNDAVSCYEARFRPDGQQAGFSLSGGSAYFRTILDIKTGRIFCEPGSYEKFFWAGDRHWCYNSKSLYDIAYRRQVWNYSTSGVSATAVGEGTDGQMWFDAHAPGSNATHWLASAKTPSADTLQQIDGLFAGKVPLVDRGSQVSLDVACENAGLNQKVTAALTSKLKANGIEVANGARIRVSATANVTDTKTKEYESIGGRGGNITVNVTTLTCAVKFLDNGTSIWETTTKVSSDPGLIITGDVSKQEQSHWPKAERWLLAAPLPNRIYPPPTPGSSNLAFPGVVNKAAPPALADNASAAAAAGQAGMSTPASAEARAAEARARLGRNPFNPIAPAEAEEELVTLSKTEVRQQVADDYLKILKKQSWDDLRGNSTLNRPVVEIRWALGTEVSPQAAKRDVDNFSRYAGRQILDGLKKAEPGAATPPEPVVLGLGTRGKLLKEARGHWTDLLLLADVETKLIGLTKRTNTTITVRVIDVESGDQLWTSEPLTQLNPIIGRQFAEYVLKEVGKTFALRRLAAPTAAAVARRTEVLGKKKFLNPLSALAEVGHYRDREVLTEEAAGKLYGEILGPAEGVQYATADAAKRGDLIDKWLPGWINEE